MSVQEPEERFERDAIEEEVAEETQDSLDSSLPDSNSSDESESVGVPTDETPLTPSDDSDSEDEGQSEELDIPAIKKLPLSSSDELPPPEPT
jgi:hypothetical protein